MVVERIKNDVLDEARDLDNKFADGEVLYGIDLNEIVRLFRAGVNANYTDIIKIITGSNSDESVYQVYPDASDLPISADENDIAFVFGYTTEEGDLETGIFLYRYNTTWNQIEKLSLIDLYNRGSKTFLTSGSTYPSGIKNGDIWFNIKGG